MQSFHNREETSLGMLDYDSVSTTTKQEKNKK